MCGLVGVVYKHTISGLSQDTFNELLFADVVRGRHATGVAAVRSLKDKRVDILKDSVPSPKFISSMAYQKFMTPSTNVLIGHNRHATKGGHHSSNAHPFRYKHITLAHNGTLRNHDDLPGNEKFVVDSEALTYAMSITDDKKELLESIDGAFALTWYDQKLNTLNFARNDERPLAFCVNQAGDRIFWASEMDMLKWVVNRNMKDKYDFLHLNSGVWMHFDLNKCEFKEKDWTHTSFSVKPKTTSNVKYLPGNNKWDNYHHNWQAKEDQTLAELGLERGDLITIKIKKFVSHNNNVPSSRGNVFGNSIFDVMQDVDYIAYSVTPDEMRTGYLQGRVGGVTTLAGGTAVRLSAVIPVEVDGSIGTVEDDEMVPGPNNMLITGETYKELISDGCINCGTDLSTHDPADITWVNGSQDPLCHDCLDEFTKVNNGSKN